MPNPAVLREKLRGPAGYFYVMVKEYRMLSAISTQLDALEKEVSAAYLIRDLKKTLTKYEAALLTSNELQVKFQQFQAELSTYEYRYIAP